MLQKSFNQRLIKQVKFYSKKKKEIKDQWMEISQIDTMKEKYLNFYPKEHLPSPVVYDGPQIFKVSYVLERTPVCTYQEHPLEIELQNETEKENHYYSRNKYHSFEEYYEAWKQEKQVVEKKLNKKKKKNLDFTREFANLQVPDPKYTKDDVKNIYRMMAKKEGAKAPQEILRTFNPMPRYTLDDLEDNRHSLNRKLMNNLYLIVKDKETGKWKFPETVRQNPLTLRLSIEKKFMEDMEGKVVGKFNTHHPFGHHNVSKNENIYFFRSIFLSGKVTSDLIQKQWADFQWVTRQELRDYELEYETSKQMFLDVLEDGFEFFDN
jgi:large subunit ribosomal protein L46